MISQKIFYQKSFLRTSLCKFFSSQLQLEKISKRVTSKKVINTDIVNYLKECGLDHLVDQVPKNLFSQSCKQRTRLYLINPDVAESLATMISKDLLQNTSHVIETNPGLGFLTKKLLDMGVPSVTLYEKNECFVSPESPLGSLLKSHESKLKFKKLDFVDIWYTLLLDKYNHDKFSEAYLVDTPYSGWRSKTFAQIITYSPGRFSVSLLIHNFFNFTEIFEHGRPSFFLVLPESIWKRISSDEKASNRRFYNQFSVMMHLFFDQKILGELSRRAFLPWPSGKTKEKTTKLLNEPMLVVKIEPKISVLYFIKKEELKVFWHFLKFCLKSSKTKVIMEFEKFVPGCGPRLILEGIDVCTKFKKLPPKKLLELFKLFKSWPEYDENSFCPSSIVDNKREDDKIEDDEHILESGELNNEIKEKER